MRVPLLDLRLQYAGMRREVDEAILSAIERAQYVEGAAVKQFETEFASYCQVREAIALDSGTAALHLALLALGVGPGDEVIVPAFTFIASAAAVEFVGARPVFVDSDEQRWLMDLDQVRGNIGPHTRAVIGVHLYGQPLEMDRLMAICMSRGIPLIEDAAQAHGARYKGKPMGSFGAVGCFSFYPTKNLGAFGDGGAITTNDAALAGQIRLLRNHGRTGRFEHARVGYNFRMDEIQGVVLHLKLARLERWNEARRRLASQYRRRLAALPLRVYAVPADCLPVYHLMAVCCPDRDRLAKFLGDHGIETGLYYPVPLHLQPAFKALGYKAGDLPVCERIARETISLPLFPEMTAEQVDYVCDSVEEFFRGKRA